MHHSCQRGLRNFSRFLLACAFSLIPLVGYADISRPQGPDGVTDVLVGVYVIDVDEVDTANQSFTANVYVHLAWHDPRLAFEGAERVSKSLNEVWHPRIQIMNQQRIWKTLPDVVEVSADGSVVFRQRYWGDFSQPLRLKDFPFDSQSLKIHLIAPSNRPHEVRFSNDRLSGMAEEFSVADWQIDGYQSIPEDYGISTSNEKVAGFSFTIEASRKSGYFWVKVIIPLIFIVMMSWIVFWIDPRESGSQISVAVTSMLTLIAYRFAVGASMPKLSYLTRLDFFILGGTVLVFASLVEVVVTSTYAKIGRVERAQCIDRWARAIFPICFILLALQALVFGRG